MADQHLRAPLAQSRFMRSPCASANAEFAAAQAPAIEASKTVNITKRCIVVPFPGIHLREGGDALNSAWPGQTLVTRTVIRILGAADAAVILHMNESRAAPTIIGSAGG